MLQAALDAGDDDKAGRAGKAKERLASLLAALVVARAREGGGRVSSEVKALLRAMPMVSSLRLPLLHSNLPKNVSLPLKILIIISLMEKINNFVDLGLKNCILLKHTILVESTHGTHVPWIPMVYDGI